MGWSSVNISMSSQLIAFKNKNKNKKAVKLTVWMEREKRWMVL